MSLWSLSKNLYSRFSRKPKKESFRAEEPAPAVADPAPPAQTVQESEPSAVEPAAAVDSEPSAAEPPPLSGTEIAEIARLAGSAEPWILEGFRRDTKFRKQLADLRALHDVARQQPRSGPRTFTTYEISRIEAMFGPLEPAMLNWIAATWSEGTLQAIIDPPTIHTRTPQSPEMKRCEQIGGYEASRKPSEPTGAEIARKLAGMSDAQRMEYLTTVGDSQGRIYDPSRGEMVVDLRKIPK